MHSARNLGIAIAVAVAVVGAGGTVHAKDGTPKGPEAKPAAGPPGSGPGPAAGVNGPDTEKREEDPAKPSSNPWAKAGVSAGDSAGRQPSSSNVETRGGPELGARVGYMLPLGESAKGASLGDTISGGVPLMLDAGYRIIAPLYVGLYGQFAFAFLSDKACPSAASCSANDLRFGVNVHYHFTSGQPYDVWIGAGVGYEILNYKITIQDKSGDGSASGFEFVNGQLGFDYMVEPQVRVGPFANFSVGQYSSISANGQSGDIKDKAIHEWLAFGIRGAYDF